jgi:hypothetical protein
MSIDADLNAGVINEADARRRRREIAEEADFYGSMDGASKFVRGDAIAAVIIVFVNIIGGLAIAIMIIWVGTALAVSTAGSRAAKNTAAESLRAVISQSLLKKNGGGRVAAHEIMIGTPAIRNLIRENKIAQMYSAIQTGHQYGMQTLDQCLQGLVQKGLVSRAEAKFKAQNKDLF